MAKVSNMESKETAAQQLRDLERAEAAPYIDYPPTPRWYPPAGGVFALALFAHLYAVLVHSWGGIVASLSLAALVAVELGFLYWYSRYHGALPAPGRTPPVAEICRAYGQFLVGFVVLVVLVTGVTFLAGPIGGGVATFVLAAGGLLLYERAYASAARAARERLS
ncbi:MAG: hypothetical protein JWO46_1695 [Nocardioidaceae bacterium]|nr:hypothetical protein [Nocardioidaceae bacterium]